VSPADYVLIGAVVFAATALQASIGFGMGMVAAPVIALVDPHLLPGTVIMLALLVTVLVTIRERVDLDLRGAGWALVGRVPGSIAGVFLVVALPGPGLSLLVALAVLSGVGFALMGWTPRLQRSGSAASATASGVMGTATSIGGAPMALVWQKLDGARLRGTMSAFFMVGSAVSLGGLALAGTITREILLLALWMVPVVLAGYVASRYLNRFLDRGRLRLVALTVSGVGAVLLLGRLLLG
jgi:uncharacterized membrane protein YfcA